MAGFMFFLTSAVGLIVISRRVARDPKWRRLAKYTLVAGIVALIGFLAGGTLFMPADAPLHDWAGLYQRVLILAVVEQCSKPVVALGAYPPDESSPGNRVGPRWQRGSGKVRLCSP